MTQIDEGPEAPGVRQLLTFGAPSIGEVLADRYQLQEHIGNDTFGRQIWRGIDVVLRRPVAVVLRYPGGRAAVEMLDAAVTVSRVEHPFLVDVYDAIDEGNRAYVVREWVTGACLRDIVLDTPLDPERATTVGRCVAEAVAALHAAGMAHGNIHPGTVLIGTDGRIIVSDVRADGKATYDADVRAVGAVLYAALTGYWPHAEAGEARLPDSPRDSSGAPLAVRAVRAGIPAHLSDLVESLVDRRQELPSADVLATELRRLDADSQEEFFGGGGPFAPTAPGLGEAVEPRRRIGRKISVGVTVLLALAVGGVLLANTMLGAAGSPTPGATASGGTRGGPPAQPIALVISPSQVRIVDPGGNRTEIRDAANIVDGDLNTAWYTDHYRTSPQFGGLKKGMGILIDLGSPRGVTDVQVALTAAGASVQLFGGQTDPGDSTAGDTQIVQTYQALGDVHSDAGTNVDLTVPSDDQVRYLLVWITRLPPALDNPSQYQVGIDEIKVLAS